MNVPLTVSNIEHRFLWQLKSEPNAIRTHSASQIKQIAKSIREFGFINPILITPDGTIIAGHARHAAACQIGMVHVPVIVIGHLSETQRRALVIADNQLGLNAGWNEEALRAELAALEAERFDLDAIGFDEEELKRLVAEQTRLAEEELREITESTPVPTLAQVPVSQAGDVWALGPHRVSCGESNDAAVMEFVDTMCRRWQQLTRKPAILEPGNQSFQEIEGQRVKAN